MELISGMPTSVNMGPAGVTGWKNVKVKNLPRPRCACPNYEKDMCKSFSSNSTVAIAPILVCGTFLVACQQTRQRFLLLRKNIFRTSATCCYLQGWACNFKNVALQKQNAICKPRAQYAKHNCAFKLFEVHCPTPINNKNASYHRNIFSAKIASATF